jgi:hypothetical protein
MPKVMLPTSNLNWSVDRPVITGIVRDIMEITHISSQTPINYFGIDGKASQQNSTMDSGNPVGENRWPYDERVIIEVQEDYNLETILSTPVGRPEYRPFFSDAALGVMMRPAYSMSKVAITFKYRTRDKNEATKWRNEMRMRASMMRDINLHEIDYHFTIPKAFLNIVAEIHRLRESQGGYGESLSEYFTGHLTTNCSLISNMSGSVTEWAVKEHQVRVQGYYDFEGAPEKGDREEEHDNWGIGFTYNFTYQKPVACYMDYPLVVHNQLLDQKYRPDEKDYKLDDQQLSYSLSGLAYAYFESDNRILRSKSYEGVNIPVFDEFVPSSVLPSTVKVFTALAAVTPSDLRNLFNLSDLGDFNLDPVILNFLKTEYMHLGKDFKSIFSLSLYSGHELMESGSLSVDANLNVQATFDLDLRKVYHVRMGLVTDFRYLVLDVIRRLQNSPEVGLKVMGAINASIRGFNGSRKDVSKNMLSETAVTLITGKTLPADYMRNANIHFITSFYTKTNFLGLSRK